MLVEQRYLHENCPLPCVVGLVNIERMHRDMFDLLSAYAA
jgi:hypothetical protein